MHCDRWIKIIREMLFNPLKTIENPHFLLHLYDSFLFSPYISFRNFPWLIITEVLLEVIQYIVTYSQITINRVMHDWRWTRHQRRDEYLNVAIEVAQNLKTIVKFYDTIFQDCKCFKGGFINVSRLVPLSHRRWIRSIR